MTVTMKSQDGFVLVWAPVPYLLLNGFLSFYNVSVQATGTVTRYLTTRNNTIRFDTLDFGRDYTVKVRATNEVGSGPAAMITVRVPQDSKYASLCFIHNACDHSSTEHGHIEYECSGSSLLRSGDFSSAKPLVSLRANSDF